MLAVFLEEMSRVFTPPQAAAENTVFKWSEHWAGCQGNMRPLVSAATLQYSDLRLAPSLLWISDFSSVKGEAGVSRTVNGVVRTLVKDPKLLSETQESLLLTQMPKDQRFLVLVL